MINILFTITMIQKIIKYFQNKTHQTFQDEAMLRIIKIEYSKDWEHVYQMYKEGKKIISN